EAGSTRGDDEATSCCNFDRVAVRTTRTFAAILSLRHNSSFTELMSRSTPPLGLGTKSIAPRSSAFNVTSAPSRDSELTSKIGRGLLDIMISVACRPTTCGILMSMLMTPGLSVSVWVPASRPSRASPHTSSCGSDAMMPWSTLRMNAESSTISTRVFLLSVICYKTFLLSCSRFFQHLSCRRTDQLGHRCNKLVFLHWLGQECHCPFLHCPITMFRART